MDFGGIYILGFYMILCFFFSWMIFKSILQALEQISVDFPEVRGYIDIPNSLTIAIIFIIFIGEGDKLRPALRWGPPIALPRSAKAGV